MVTPRLNRGTRTRVVGVPLKLSKQANLGLIIFFILLDTHNVQVAILTLIKHAIGGFSHSGKQLSLLSPEHFYNPREVFRTS